MPFVTKYGTYFGLAPAQLGRVHFVAPSSPYTVDGRSYDASDDNDGLSPERALSTIGQAYTDITASAGEVIMLLEGSHTRNSTLRIQKAGITIAGIRSTFASDLVAGHAYGAGGLKSVLNFTGAAAPGLSIEADDVEIAFLELRPASGFGTVIFRNASPDALYIHDSIFNLAAGQAISLDTAGIDFGYRADVAGLATRSMTRLTQTTQRATAYLANIAIVSGGAVGPGVLTATADLTVVGSRLHTRAGAWASPFVVATGTGFVFVQGSSWTAQGTTGMTLPVDGSFAGIIAGKVFLDECRFPVANPAASSPVKGFATGVAAVTECYQGNSGTAVAVVVG